MPDQKQIITGLQDAAAYFRSSFDAMYGTVACEMFRNWTNAIEQAIALLKAQEPVEYVVHCKNADLSNGTEFACGECGGSLLHRRVNYCPNCGRAVKWNA